MLGSGKEIIHFMRATKSLASALYVAKRLSKHAVDVMRHGRGMNLTNGNALAGRLAKSAFDLKIPLWLSSPVRELIVEDGAVRGAHGRTRRATGSGPCQTRRGARLRRLSARRRHGARRCFRTRRPATSIFRPARPATPATDCGWPKSAGGRVEDSLPNAAAWVPVSITDTQGRQQGRDAAFHRPRQTRRDRGDARRHALCQ